MKKFYDDLNLLKKGLNVQSSSLLDETVTISTKDYNEYILACNNVVDRINLYMKVYNYFLYIDSFDAVIESEYCHNITIYDIYKIIDKHSAIDVSITEHYKKDSSFFIIDIYS